MNYLIESNFFSLDLKFEEKLVKMVTRKMHIIISLITGWTVYTEKYKTRSPDV